MHRRKKQLFIYGGVVVGMFAFSYALVPIYNVMCKVLGINGKVVLVASNNTSHVDYSRSITMQFLATNNASIDWEFHPDEKEITLHPGANNKVSYYARNNTDHTMTVQAIPSITPSAAANHLHKTQCFCFNQTTLKAHQEIHMPIIFHFDNKLPKNIKEVTMSYTLFEIKKT